MRKKKKKKEINDGNEIVRDDQGLGSLWLAVFLAACRLAVADGSTPLRYSIDRTARKRMNPSLRYDATRLYGLRRSVRMNIWPFRRSHHASVNDVANVGNGQRRLCDVCGHNTQPRVFRRSAKDLWEWEVKWVGETVSDHQRDTAGSQRASPSYGGRWLRRKKKEKKREKARQALSVILAGSHLGLLACW